MPAATVLSHRCRLLERQSGSAKFGGRLLATSGLAYLLQLAAEHGLGCVAGLVGCLL